MVEWEPNVKIVAIAVREIEHDIIACAEAGVTGYVPREASIADLIAAVMGAVQGELKCSPRIARSLFRRVSVLARAGAVTSGDLRSLTPREVQIARLIHQGMSNKEIALKLCIEVATVKNHVHNILEKLQVKNRREAMVCTRSSNQM